MFPSENQLGPNILSIFCEFFKFANFCCQFISLYISQNIRDRPIAAIEVE